MLTTRSESPAACIVTGSLRTKAPAGISTVGLPLKVSAWSEFAWIDPPPTLTAMSAAPTLSASVPNSLVNCTRTDGPPILICTMLRYVELAGPGWPEFTTEPMGEAAHVPTQFEPGPWAHAARLENPRNANARNFLCMFPFRQE